MRETGATAPSGALPDGLMHKVRALLAKAESTEFDGEADAFTAKAQELMARYRIDRAMLEAEQPQARVVAARPIVVEDPYASAKAVLLGGIASANSCAAVWSDRDGFSTVFGTPADLDAIEELYTSLLVQASAAMRREGTKVDHAGRSRTKRFRRTFLLAFAVRITERLRETVHAVIDEAVAAHGDGLLPVLAARHEDAQAAAAEAFPNTRSIKASPTDREGWFKGQLFADQADLATTEQIAPRSA